MSAGVPDLSIVVMPNIVARHPDSCQSESKLARADTGQLNVGSREAVSAWLERRVAEQVVEVPGAVL
jgi:hypothetical protein